MKKPQTNQQGLVIISVLTISIGLSIIMAALVVYATSNVSRARSRVLSLESQYAAESGADAAIGYLNADPNAAYTGTGGSEVTLLNNSKYKATFSTTVVAGSAANEKIITSTGKVYSPATAATASYIRKIEVVTQHTSDSVAVTGILSRNIIEVGSGVKNVFAKDLYINGYLNTEKNTNNIVAQNITIAGKNTGASNCSIGGSGNLVKPSSFNTPGQTKTNITVAYNNCINPPGNTSNSNFNVQANQTSIPKVQSTFIPWSQYMDSSYIAAGNCNDWTTGTSPRQIPSVLNSKKTHYPDNGSNISTSCGTSGDLSLGSNQYNITDNVHIRANLCSATACNPIFYNPSGNVHYIFVEGYVNFNSINTAAGSGPLVLISYGADNSLHTNACPLGDAIYVGNSGQTVAPAVYLLANNGICLDQTKFGATPALGGLSGKNIFIATNPGTPFDLNLNATFDSSVVPINLSWHAERYRRL
ncbi:MAG TPA: hypothetical protein VFH37_01505 [Candidatus Saccharimonadales bacterium]|nr:hypothetical protein [Candidatus Saccharimonadales bacterium]